MPSAPRVNNAVVAKPVAGADVDKNASRRAAKRRAHAGSDDDASDARKRSKHDDAKEKEEPEVVIVRNVLRRNSRTRRARARHAGSASSSSRSVSSASTPRSRTEPVPESAPAPDDDETPKKKSSSASTPRVKGSASDVSAEPPPAAKPVAAGAADPPFNLASMEDEIAQLKRQLAERDLVIDRQHGVLTAVHNTLQCQVCLEILSKPFVLPKCGHVCCQGCLESWFAQCPQADGLYDDDELPLRARRKTCPHCREVVRSAPTKLYIVKSLAGIMDAPGVLDKTALREPTREPSVLAPEDAVDPFARFFAPEAPRGPIVDHDDGGILRCESCLGEVWRGSCVICGRLYDFEEFSDALDESYGEEDDGSGSENSLVDFIEYDHPLGMLANILAVHAGYEHYDDDAEEELHEIYSALNAGSDVEDENSHAEEYSSAREDVRGFIEELSGDDEDEDEDVDDEPPARPSRWRQMTSIPASSINDDEEGDDEEEDEDEEVHDVVYHSRPRHTRSRIVIDSEDEGSAEEDEGSCDDEEGSLADERLSEEEYWSNSQGGGSDEESW